MLNNTKPVGGLGATDGRRNGDKHGGSSGRNSTTNPAKLQLRNPAGKVCGTLAGQTLRKTVSRTRHQLLEPPAWALDAEHLDIMERAGCKVVELRDRDDGSTWTATLADFQCFGFTFDRGYGRQVGLALGHWKHIVPGAPVQLAFAFGA
jgi:hypothetical protein